MKMNKSVNATELSEKLLNITESSYRKLKDISEVESGKKPQYGGWSHKEIIGHLIDSASNNHQRFVRAQLKNDLIFIGYQQDEWINVQQYQTSPWLSLINLWYEINMHLSRVIAAIPDETLLFNRTEHNLDEIAWKPVAKSEPVTLAYCINDYIGHMQHHLKKLV